MFKDENGQVLYVGKAKELSRRLSSYFRNEAALPRKTVMMLAKAVALETISTKTNNEAFLLEASLIKKHRPHYNIVLRDDKEYSLFKINTKNTYPRLEIVRQVRGGKTGPGNGIKLFGPYSSGRDAKITWKAIHKIFPLRRCSDKGMKNRSRGCLYHHIGQCPAPCVLPVDKNVYAAMVNKVIMLLQGRSRELVHVLQQEMQDASGKLQFEYAAVLRDQIRAVEHTLEKQSVVLSGGKDADFIGLAETESGLSLGILFVRGGALLGSRNFFWPKLGLEDAAELLLNFLLQFYVSACNLPPRIVLPWKPRPEAKDALTLPSLEGFLRELHGSLLHMNLPKNESEGRLINLASANAREYARKQGQVDLPALLGQVFMPPGQTLARADAEPAAAPPVLRIEAVDVSHTSGSATRAAMVVFEEGEPRRDLWRNYAFEDVLPDFSAARGDDYAILAAWAERRIKDGPPWPDLLLIDGGRGQLGAIRRVFEKQGLHERFYIAAIAKARTEEGFSDRRAGNIEDRIFVPERSNPLNIKAGSPELLFLQHVRNTVHDFVLGRHKKARTKQALRGELSRIPGFGSSLTRALWEQFDSLPDMAAASDEDLRRVPGMGIKRIQALREQFELVLGKTD
jgi:excinuclease ABC subunit C